MRDLVRMNDLEHSSRLFIPRRATPPDLHRVRVEAARLVHEGDDGQAREERMGSLQGRFPESYAGKKRRESANGDDCAKKAEGQMRRTIVHGKVAILAPERLEPLAEQRKVLGFILCHLQKVGHKRPADPLP